MKHTTQKRITEIENLILENDLNLSNPYDASMATAIIAIIAPFPPETTIWGYYKHPPPRRPHITTVTSFI